MDILILILGTLSGICIGAGLIYLFTGLRRPGGDWLHLIFAFFALAYAGANLTSILEYKTTTLGAFMRLGDWTALFTGLTLILLLWFVAVYTKVQPRIFMVALTAIISLVVLVAILRPNSIYTEVLGIYVVTLPWGETIVRLDATESIWGIIFFLSTITLVGFLIYACVRQFLSGERNDALALGFGLFFLMVALIFDILLIDSGALNTEEELANYRQELQSMVAERTYELEQSNLQLSEEVAERERADKALRRRIQDLNLINQVSHVLTKTADLRASLQRASEILTQHFDIRYTHIIVYAVETESLMVLNGFDREDGVFGRTELHISLDELPKTGQVLREGKSLVVPDLQSMPLESSINAFVTSRNLQSVLLVPLQVSGAVIGLLVLGSDQTEREFTPDEVTLTETIAGDIAVTIENTRLQEQEMASAASEERTRLARDLHDAVTQTIYSASLITEVLPAVWERDPKEGRRNLVKLRQLVRGALGEMRTLLFELRPAALESADLSILLGHLSDALTGRTRIPVQAEIDGAAALPKDVKVALYRITQEVFNNVAKHSEATRVELKLRSDPGQVKLNIQDNGRGFKPELVPADKLGIRIMQERAEEVGARLEVLSEQGRGTQVSVGWTGETVVGS
jgi:signal transduction histidine kinase